MNRSMSGPYLFGVRSRTLSRAQVSAREKAAKRHGCVFIYAKMPDGLRSWFECEAQGVPFDQATERDVLAEIGGRDHG